MFLNWNLNMLINAWILMTFTTFSLVRGGNQKNKYYNLPQIDEKYSDYKAKKINLPVDEKILPLKEFYDTVYNVQFVQLQYLFGNSYDQYKENLIKYCNSTKYATYLIFFIDSTLEHFVTLLNNLVTDLKETIDDQEKGDLKTKKLTTLLDDMNNCIKDFSFKQLSKCIETALSKEKKLTKFQKNISDFRKGMISMKNGDLTFNKKMVPILRIILNGNFRKFDLNTTRNLDTNKNYLRLDQDLAKNLYTEYLDAFKTDDQVLDCQKKYKQLDKATYTSKNIGLYFFPQKNEKSFEVFKNRRIQFVYHLRELFQIMGIPNEDKFKLLLNTSRSIDKSYFEDLKSFRALAKENYESYALRIMAKGYYPLPEKLWKNEKPRK